MLLATHPAFCRAQLSDVTSPLISRLCRNLRGILSGKAQPPPMLRQQNGWGEFILRAYPLNNTHTASSSVMVVIQRRVPLAIKIMSNMSTSSWAVKQREGYAYCYLTDIPIARLLGACMSPSIPQQITYGRSMANSMSWGTVN